MHTCFGQTNDILNESLSKKEYEYLNNNLDSSRFSYNFTNKKVAFFSSPGGTILRSKNDFFQTDKNDNYITSFFSIVIFNEKQKSNHGYDVAVIYESKNMNPKVSNKLKRLVRKNNYPQQWL
jgi:hypothetical protein